MSRVSEYKLENLSRLKSVSEDLIISGTNTVNLSFQFGSGNIGYVQNPTGPITLSVADIPISNFDTKSLTFSVIVNQSTVSYACTTILLNGVSRPIKWQNGSVGKGTINSIDIFNFVAINTVGSGNNINNYLILGNVNGGYK